jgi:hypothetical protein
MLAFLSRRVVALDLAVGDVRFRSAVPQGSRLAGRLGHWAEQARARGAGEYRPVAASLQQRPRTRSVPHGLVMR